MTAPRQKLSPAVAPGPIAGVVATVAGGAGTSQGFGFDDPIFVGPAPEHLPPGDSQATVIANELRSMASRLEDGTLTTEQLTEAVSSTVAAYGANTPAAPEPLNGADLLTDHPPIHDPVLSGLFDRHSLVEIVAPSKTRKSFAAMQIALALASGRDAFGFEVRRPLSVCIADFELREADLHRRLWRMGRTLRIGAADVTHRLRILPLAGVANPILAIEREAALFDVLIVDPLYALCDGPETIEFMREPMRWLRRLATTKAGVLFVHHDAKGLPGDRDTRDRGSGSNITGRSVDARITLTPAAADPENTIVMGFMCRSYKTPTTTAWTFEDDAFHPSDLPAEPERQADRRARQGRPKIGQYTDAALRILTEHGPMTPSLFKQRMREELNVSKGDADTLTATLCKPGGPARRWATKSFPPDHFIGTVEQSSQSSQEDRQEDREDSLASLPARLIGGRTGRTVTGGLDQ